MKLRFPFMSLCPNCETYENSKRNVKLQVLLLVASSEGTWYIWTQENNELQINKSELQSIAHDMM